MATKFKVPKSPKKSIFEIDNFLGVDLTNNGTNIDENRSPNAPNMVRNVPGKVRKRTGFHTETVFGNGLNTNIAIGADENVKEIEVSTSMVRLYDLFITKRAADESKMYFDFEYMSSGKIWITSLGWLDASPDEYTHVKESVDKGNYAIPNLNISGEGTYTVKIRKFSFMFDQDENYYWQKSPKYFVYRATNDPVYGCHRMKHGTFDGNRVVNVNRVLETSNTNKEVSLTTSESTIYSYAEWIQPERRLYVEFDYEVSGSDAYIYICGNEKKLSVTESVTHVSYSTASDTSEHTTITAKSDSTSTLKIKNLSVMYDKNDEYKWSVAPEDLGKEFHLEDTYIYGYENYADFEKYSHTYDAEGTSLTVTIPIAKSSMPNSRSHVEFDLYASLRRTLTSLKISLINTNNAVAWSKTYSGDYGITHFDLCLPMGSSSSHVSSLKLEFTYPSVSYEIPCWVRINNLKINAITPRTKYDISSVYQIYHVGTDLFLKQNNSEDFTNVCSNANPSLSKSWQIGETLLILDGSNVFTYQVGAETVSSVSDGVGYIPLITIGKSPQGGGTSYEDLNLLQPGFYETFYVSSANASATTFYLSFANLDNTTVKAWVMSSTGAWIEKTEGTDFSVFRGGGYVIFTSAPGASPLTGEDNVKILAYRTVPGYKERITNCTIGTLFGVNGASDRLFLSGNPDYPNYDWYSEQYDLTYFPDTGYSALGLSSSAIVGYAVVNNYLATFKDEYEPSQSVFIRSGDTVTDENTKILRPAFKLINTLQGNGVIAPNSFGYLQTEPLFLTRSGVFAITAQDITGEKYSQNRSFYLDGALTEEPNLENAYATIFNDMYVLAINNKLYILDGLQATRTDKSEPYATRQYVGFVCTDIPANCLWVDNHQLSFGTNDGHICKFATDTDDLESYNDNGKAIYCCWETPDLDGQLFYKNKSFRYIAIRMTSALKTSVKLWAMARGAWSFIKEDTTSGIYFDFENIDFESFSFSTDRSDKVAHSKIRVKKVDKARFKIENSNLNEPFGLLNLALEYVESGNYKG